MRVYDDYAHHPTELEATLTAAREFLGEAALGRRLPKLTTISPHRLVQPGSSARRSAWR